MTDAEKMLVSAWRESGVLPLRAVVTTDGPGVERIAVRMAMCGAGELRPSSEVELAIQEAVRPIIARWLREQDEMCAQIEAILPVKP